MVVVAAVAIVCLLLLPHLVAKRTAITQSREIDRFSPRMRVLRTEDGDQEGSQDTCRSPERRLLASASGHRATGGTMSSHIEDGRRPVVGARAVHRENARIREIAQLRARRAARLANERAAGQRRLLASAVTAVATLVVVVLAAFSLLGWSWVALPAALLAAALGTSRWAAVRSEAEGRREDARLRQLREGLDPRAGRVPPARGRTSGPVRSPAEPVRAPAADGSSTSSGVGGEGGAVAAVDGVERLDAPPGTRDRGAAQGESSDAPTPVGVEAPLDDAGEDSGTVERSGAPEVDRPRPDTVGPREVAAGSREATVGPRTWSVSAVPTPTYASRARVVGREVHADTDLRGIPAVDSAVPARPQASGHGAENARSTEDVAASQPVVFDLDAVLDNRRAQ